jgi:hypothetical protein
MTERASPAATDVQSRRFTSDEVQAMLRAGIPEVWIVDLDARQVEVHREPDDDVYRTRHLAGRDDTVTPERPSSLGPLQVRDLLGDLPEPESEATGT